MPTYPPEGDTGFADALHTAWDSDTNPRVPVVTSDGTVWDTTVPGRKGLLRPPPILPE